jgi:nucleoside-diphosphate-sugar epimerase
MKYVVTRAAGFIRSHLSEALREVGHEVRGIDCFTDYYDPALKEENARGLGVERVDLANEPLSFAGLDGVFHLAGQPGPTRSFENFPLYLRRNVEAAQHVFEAAARDGVRVVFASSSSVYGDVDRFPTPEDALPVPLSPYGVTNLAAPGGRARTPPASSRTSAGAPSRASRRAPARSGNGCSRHSRER